MIEGPFERDAATSLGDGAHGEGGADLALRMPAVEDTFEIVATTGLGDGAHGAADDAGLVPRTSTVEEPHEVAALGSARTHGPLRGRARRRRLGGFLHKINILHN
jgi:hypothetical protein